MSSDLRVSSDVANISYGRDALTRRVESIPESGSDVRPSSSGIDGRVGYVGNFSSNVVQSDRFNPGYPPTVSSGSGVYTREGKVEALGQDKISVSRLNIYA